MDEVTAKRWETPRKASEHKPIDIANRLVQLLSEDPERFDHITVVGHKQNPDGSTAVTFLTGGTSNTSLILGDLERAKLLICGLQA